jgi:glycosyltransferase involved in cell wall biosynthesis
LSAAPPVSVLLPIRDGAAWLIEAIASLEVQTASSFEVLAVDDGSTDRTPEILAEWAARDARVRVVRQEAAGIVPALERARAMARGTYLARMDADDVCAPTRLALQRALMDADRSLAACGTGVRYFPRRFVRDGARRYEAWLNQPLRPDELERELFVECPLAHPAFFLRASAVAAVGGYRDRGWPEDYDLLLRLWEAGGRLARVPDVLLHWRERPGSLHRTHPAYLPAAFVRCKVHYLRRTLLRDRDGAVVWGAGPVGKAFARALLEAKTPVLAFAEVDSRKIGQRVHGAPVLDTEGGLAVRGALHVAAVGQVGARRVLRDTLAAGGLRELQDFVAVA